MKKTAKDKTRLLKERGIRITPQRTAVLEEIGGEPGHPSAADVYAKVRRRLPNISFDTVYRTLFLFLREGIIKPAGLGGEARFEPNLEEHHHLTCLECRKIHDFFDEELDNVKIPDNLGEGFRVIGKRVVLEGFCRECDKKLQ